MKNIGIDIGSYSIKLVELDATANQFRISHLAQWKFSDSQSKDLSVEKHEILQEIAKRYDPESTRIVTGLRQEFVSHRQRLFPFRERQKIAKSIGFELEDDIPFSHEDAVFETKIVHFRKEGAQVLATACPKTYIEDHLQELKSVDIDPDIVSVEGLALVNLFEDWNQAPPEIAKEDLDQLPLRVLLQLGHTRSLALAFLGDQVVTARSLYWGGQKIIDAVARKFDVHPSEAAKTLQEKGFVLTDYEGASQDQVTFSRCVDESFEAINQELQLIFLNLQSEYSRPINEILVTGGLSQLNHLCPYLTQKFSVRTNILEQADPHNNLQGQLNEQQRAEFSVALGLAIEACRRPRNPTTDLRKNEFGKKSETLQLLWDAWRTTAQLVAAATVLLFIYSWLREDFALSLADQAHENLKHHAKNTAQISSRTPTMAKIRSYIKSKEEAIQNQELFEKVEGFVSPLSILSQLSQSLPDKRRLEVEIHHLAIEGLKLSIEGTVTSSQQIKPLELALKSMARKGQIKKQKAKLAPAKGQVPFSYVLQVSRFEKDS